MKEFNLYKDIKNSISQNAFLIKKYGFKEFEEEQLAYEYHFTTSNEKGDNIDISFEAISSSPIWVRINNVHFEKIFEDKQLEKIEYEISTLYKNIFNKYLELDDKKYLESNLENYRIKGRNLNHQKLSRIFEILGKNLEDVLIKSNFLYASIENPSPLSKTTLDLQKLSGTVGFNNNFQKYEKMIIETDKCEIDIHSMEELNEILKSLSEQNIKNIEWEFIE